MHGRTIIKEMLQHDFYVYYIGSQQTDAVATSSPRKTSMNPETDREQAEV